MRQWTYPASLDKTDEDTDPSIPAKYVTEPIRAPANFRVDDDETRWSEIEDDEED